MTLTMIHVLSGLVKNITINVRKIKVLRQHIKSFREKALNVHLIKKKLYCSCCRENPDNGDEVWEFPLMFFFLYSALYVML